MVVNPGLYHFTRRRKMGDSIYVVDCFTYGGSEWQEIFTDTDELVEYIKETRKCYYSAGFRLPSVYVEESHRPTF